MIGPKTRLLLTARNDTGADSNVALLWAGRVEREDRVEVPND